MARNGLEGDLSEIVSIVVLKTGEHTRGRSNFMKAVSKLNVTQFEQTYIIQQQTILRCGISLVQSNVWLMNAGGQGQIL